jgi:hypothetical protein
MTEINDFGFTAVDQEELVTKTGDKAGIGEKLLQHHLQDKPTQHK